MKYRKCMACNISISERPNNCIRCKECQAVSNKKGKRAGEKRWRENNRIRARKSCERWRKKNPLYSKEWWRKEREELGDHYIKQLLAKKSTTIPLKSTEVTPELIELKRKELLLRRLLGQRSQNTKTYEKM